MSKSAGDHPITIETEPRRVTVEAGGRTIIEANVVLVLKEAGYKPVFYFARDAAAMPLLEKSDHVTHCPYKGDATHYHVRTPDGLIENAVWSYENPKDGVSDIKDHLAVYPSKLDMTEH